MGGTSKQQQAVNQAETQNQNLQQTQTQNEIQNQIQNTLQNVAQNQQQNVNQQQNPWLPSQGLLTGILGSATPLAGTAGSISPAQQVAFDQLRANAQQGNPYAPAIGAYASNLLGGGGANAQAGNLSGALSTLQGQLSPYASGSQIGANNPYVNNLLDTLGTDISGRINAQYAGAGRDLSGLNQQNVARGLSQGLAPVLLGQYNTDVQNQLGAANTLYGAANTTGGLLSGLNQQALANQGQGVSAADAALAAQNYGPNQQLAIAAAQYGLPISQLQQLAALGVPIAGLGTTTTGTTTGQLTGQTTGQQTGQTTGQMTGTGTQTGTTTGTRQGTIDVTNQMSPVQQAQGWANVFGNLFPSRLTQKPFF